MGAETDSASPKGLVLDGTPLELLASGIDRDLPIPLNIQLRGVIEYGILMGSLPAGSRLPSVRDLAEGVGVATMTVVSVYGKLKEAGLIETRGKAGTFVAEVEGLPGHDALRRLNRAIDDLLDMGHSLGIDAQRIAELIGVRGNLRRARPLPPLRILFAGLFDSATADYAQFVRNELPENDQIDATTIDTLRRGTPSISYDLVLTLANRRSEVQALFPAEVPVVGLNFIPSVETRTRLAGLDPASRVGMISTFRAFTALMRQNVLRFIPHVTSAEIIGVDAPDLKAFLQRVDVVVYATGSDRVLAMVSDRQIVFEYRHMPDPKVIQSTIVPLLEEIRAANMMAGGTDA
jgi:DNA-binding transcriptional regulator YhcF (GntR family)